MMLKKHANPNLVVQPVKRKPKWAGGKTVYNQLDFYLFQKLKRLKKEYFAALAKQSRYARYVRKMVGSDGHRYVNVYKITHSTDSSGKPITTKTLVKRQPLPPVERPEVHPSAYEPFVGLYEIARMPSQTRDGFEMLITRAEAAMIYKAAYQLEIYEKFKADNAIVKETKNKKEKSGTPAKQAQPADNTP